MVNFKEEQYIKSLIAEAIAEDKKVNLATNVTRDGNKVMVDNIGLEIPMNTDIVNKAGSGNLISVDNSNLLYIENIKYINSFKVTLEKLKTLTEALTSSLGTVVDSKIVNDPNLIQAANDLKVTIQPLIKDLP